MAWVHGRVRYFAGKTTAPTVNDDQNDGYRVTDLWVDETGDKAYVCVDATAGVAVWTEVAGAASAVANSLFDANTILKADTDDTPVALAVPVQTLIGRITAGVTTALTAAQVRTLINVANGADVTGDNTPKAHKTSHTDGSDDIQSASTSQKGLLEIATDTEINTFSDDSRAMNYYNYSQAYVGWKTIIIKCIADDTALTTGDGKGYVTIPGSITGFDLVDVGVHIYTASNSGVPSFQIHNLTDTSDMLSTNATIAENENDSAEGGATPMEVDATEDDVVVGDVLRIDCDTAGTGAKGLEVRLAFRDRSS